MLYVPPRLAQFGCNFIQRIALYKEEAQSLALVSGREFVVPDDFNESDPEIEDLFYKPLPE